MTRAVADRPRPFAEAYLCCPELFPGRASGEAWGDYSVALSIAGGPYRLVGLDADQASALGERFGPLVLRGDAAEGQGMEIRMFRAMPGEFLPVDFTGSDYRFDVDYGPSAVRLAGKGFMARLDWLPRLSVGIWVAESADLVDEGRLENCLRLVVGYRMLELGGALLHSAGVVVDGRAWVFPGQSGSGKSTLARTALDAGLAVLSDDMNALLPQTGGGLMAQKLPFAGDLGPTETDADQYPVAGCCRLTKGAANAVAPLRRSEALALLLASAPLYL